MAELYNKIGLGLMGWSPVSFGLAQGDRQDESHGLVHKLLNKVQNSDDAGENILPFKLIIIREKYLQKGLLGKFYKEKLENSQNYQGKVS